MIIWKETIENIIQNRTISKSRLKIVPKIRTCSDWLNVKPLGIINYSTPLMKWDGYLVEFSNQLYYVEKTTYENLAKDLKWKVKDNIEVEE